MPRRRPECPRRSTYIAVIASIFCVAGCASQSLEPWHKTKLDEFEASMLGDRVSTFDDYVALEQNLFDELRTSVYSQVDTGPEYALVRYSEGSAADPATRSPDYNRSFEWPVDEPRGAVLLLHGMSDSPYSLRALGMVLHQSGYHVLGLRLPGHGTAPGELKHVSWRDMAAAVRLAADHLVTAAGDVPLHMVGYSTGSALALNYALDALEDTAIRKADSLILISPAIGVTAAAALARPIAAVGRWPGMSRLGWTAIVPEFDPYKYNSFTSNAGSQVRQLTQSVANRIGRLGERAEDFPRILVFKSAVDATVSTEAVADRLLSRLPENGNEFVLFDINRSAKVSTLLVDDPGPLTDQLMSDAGLPFSVRLITNEHVDSLTVVDRLKRPYSTAVAATEPLNLSWPAGVVSLSHVALSFPPDDPLYGREQPEDTDALFLGQIDVLGERGILRISSDWLLRIRYNPLFDVVEDRTLAWVAEFSDTAN